MICRTHLWLCFSIFFLAAAGRINAQVILPPGMGGDSLHAPFYHGVASGDPLADKIMLWTRITPQSPGPKTVYYELDDDSLFSSPLLSGSLVTDSLRDWTVKLDAGGLAANTIYYYRFHNAALQYSATGRTRTAPTGNPGRVRLAVFSCSSIYSGYFNAYARIAEKSATLNAAVHLGDYIYDFVDGQEEVRVPVPYPTEPVTLGEWRERHAYYLLDPDLRLARSRLPWIVIWDNHDLDCSNTTGICDSAAIQAFFEWLPVRMPDTTDIFRINRSFSFGDMTRLIMTDTETRRKKHQWPGGEYNLFDTTQFHWLLQELENSSATWKLVGNEKMAGGWYTSGIPQWIMDIIPNDGPVFDSSAWDGFSRTRDSLFRFVSDRSIDNLVILSGDAHVSIAQDLTSDPFNLAVYNPLTGQGSVGVEFLPTSVTRGNLDESGAPQSLAATFNNVDLTANPQHRYADLFQHGYGILDMTADSAVAEFWYSDILNPATAETLGKTMVVLAGENHWKRPLGTGLSAAANVNMLVYPNPSSGQFFISGDITGEATLYSLQGQPLVVIPLIPHGPQLHSFSLSNFAAGVYWLRCGSANPVMLIKY